MTRSLVLYAARALAGFIGSFALLYGFTLLGPVIVLAVWLAYRYLPRIGGRRLPEAWGALAGVGAFLLFLGSAIDGDTAGLLTCAAATVAYSGARYVAGGRQRCRATPATG